MYRLLVTGDLIVGERTKRERERVIRTVRSLIRSFHVDEALGNLELPLTERGFPSDKQIAWRSPLSTAQDLKEMGFTVLSLATNHGLDYGVEGLLDTMDGLDAQDIQRPGAGRNLDEALAPTFIRMGGKTTLAIFSVSCLLPGNSAASQLRPGVAPVRVRTTYEIDPRRLQERPGYPAYVHTEMLEEDAQRVCQVIRAAKERGCVTVLSIHWGIPFQKELAEYQRPLAEVLIQSGCDIIVGAHPHTFHEIDVIEKVPVLYSLGNFIVSESLAKDHSGTRRSQLPPASPEALVGILEFEEGKLAAVRLHPIVIEKGIPKRAESRQAQKMLKEVEKLSAKKLPWRLQDGMGILTLSN